MYKSSAIYAPHKNDTLASSDSLAWLSIGGFILLVCLCLLARVSSILLYAFPLGATAIGLLLYARFQVLYLGFTWWLWFLAPLVSRVVEYQNGWIDPGLRFIILAPYLVTAITFFTLFKNANRFANREGLPFILAASAILYALAIGMVRDYSITAVIQRLLSWLPAISFGFHILVNWRLYPLYRNNTLRVYYWAVLFMGAYGIFQYVVAPGWDSFWLTNAEELKLCCGWPEPYMMRVWSTLNYPFTFAYAMMVCLLLLFSRIRQENLLPILLGLISLLLSQVRGAWLGGAVGFAIFFLPLKISTKIKTILSVLILVLALVLLISGTPLAEPIGDRLSTLSSIHDDGSGNERIAIYLGLLDSAIYNVVGRGMGGAPIIDAGILDVLATLGWVGTTAYVGGILLLFHSLFYKVSIHRDSFLSACRAVAVGIFVTVPLNNPFMLLPGVMFWGFGALGMAGEIHHRNILARQSK